MFLLEETCNPSLPLYKQFRTIEKLMNRMKVILLSRESSKNVFTICKYALRMSAKGVII